MCISFGNAKFGNRSAQVSASGKTVRLSNGRSYRAKNGTVKIGKQTYKVPKVRSR